MSMTRMLVTSILTVITFFIGFIFGMRLIEQNPPSSVIKNVLKAEREGRLKYDIVTTELNKDTISVDTVNYRIVGQVKFQ